MDIMEEPYKQYLNLLSITRYHSNSSEYLSEQNTMNPFFVGDLNISNSQKLLHVSKCPREEKDKKFKHIKLILSTNKQTTKKNISKVKP